ncbi:MFS transporter [Lentilitoribacter sp. EG35]|uniref:MFS transporter n=1 Tax=Lentilitoribacter sp. EG35 TaxID=3234192 RepID=UPI00345F4487
MRAMISPVFALLVSTLLMQIGGGMAGYLLPLRAAEEGWDTLLISLFAASFAMAFTLGCVVVPRIVFLVGHIRVFSALTAAMAIALLLHSVIVDPFAWAVFRGIHGFAIAGTYMVLESWLNEKSTNEARGTIFAIYMIMSTCGIMIGQFLVPLGDTSDTILFIICALAFLASLFPTTLTTAASPNPLTTVRFDLKALFHRSPIATVTALFCGLVTGTWFSLGPVFVTLRDITTSDGAIMLASAMAGGTLGQFPFGVLSDKIDRRIVMIIISVLGSLSCLAVYFIDLESLNFFFVLMFFLGLAIFPLYSIAIAHANDFSAADEFVETSSGLLVIYGAGSVAGPIIGAFAMQGLGPEGMFALMSISFAIVAIYAAYRLQQRDQVPEEDRMDYGITPVGRSLSPQTFELDPRSDPEWGSEIEEDTETNQ